MKNEIPLSVLPADVAHHVRHQRRGWVIVSALWYIIWGVSVWRYFAGHPDAEVVGYMVPIFTAAVALLPLWIFRLGKVLFGRIWSGEIVKIKYRRMSDIPIFSEGLERVERHETAVLYVRRKPGGRTRRIACRRLARSADRCYRVGDRVRHIPFVALPQNLSRRPEGERLCLVCGTLSENSHDTCIECGHAIF